MLEVIPAINCGYKDFECVKDKVKKAEGFSKWIHLDVADGVFTFNKTWNNSDEWATLKTNLDLEVHLMVAHPERILESWLKAGAKRAIVHIEAIDKKSAVEILDIAKKYNAEVMLSLNPETTVHSAEEYFKLFCEFQVLAVIPGIAGQKFLPLVLNKVRFLRGQLPDAKIEVDGGITLETARLAKEAGADIVVSASYIFGNQIPEEAFRELSKI